MSGKEHMTIGTSAAIGLVIGLVFLGNMTLNFNMIVLIIGGIIGSYMPDIDSHKSTAAQIFNKVLTIAVIIISIFYLSIKRSIFQMHVFIIDPSIGERLLINDTKAKGLS